MLRSCSFAVNSTTAWRCRSSPFFRPLSCSRSRTRARRARSFLEGPAETELVWTYFGYQDDSAEMRRHRLRNINLVGPAGFISMEDGEAVELCQRGTAGAGEWRSLIEMGGHDVADDISPMGMDEHAVRGFWKGYFAMMERA